jgi:hypothetical protein
MAHTHHCKICKIPVAVCSDERCQGDEGHFCTIHHPDPQYQRDLQPPPGRTTVVVNVPRDTK